MSTIALNFTYIYSIEGNNSHFKSALSQNHYSLVKLTEVLLLRSWYFYTTTYDGFMTMTTPRHFFNDDDARRH